MNYALPSRFADLPEGPDSPLKAVVALLVVLGALCLPYLISLLR
jgi:hypothetical protein